MGLIRLGLDGARDLELNLQKVKWKKWVKRDSNHGTIEFFLFVFFH